MKMRGVAQSVERRAEVLLRKRKIQDSIVIAVYASSVLATAIVAPKAVQIFRYIAPYIGMRNTRARASQAISRLIGRGLLERKGYGQAAHLTLTKKGKQYAGQLFNDPSSRLTIPKKWDGRWRIVMFDIWEKRRTVRDRLRAVLQRLGFVKVQNSVWAFPYDCEEVITLVRTELRAGKGIAYMVADGIEGDKDLRIHFGLPRS